MRSLLKAVYQRLPFKRQLFTGLKSVWQPPESVFRHLHFEGPFTAEFMGRRFQIYHTGTWIENTLFWQGVGQSWERMSLRLWAQLCERARVILDIGANTGVYSTLAAAMNAQACIIAFEPIPQFNRGIQCSAELNQFNIQLRQVALSDMVGSVPFSGYQMLTRDLNSTVYDHVVWVEATTLARFVEQEALEYIDLMKIDVERHEPEVLRGMGELLACFQPDMLIEVLDDAAADALRPLLSGLDYRYFSIDDPNDRVRPLPRLESSDHWNILICKPETAEALNL